MPIKNNKKLRLLGLFAVVSVSLFACSDEKHLRDLHAYIDDLKKSITRHVAKNILEDIHFPTPVSFQNQKERDPFEEGGTTLGQGGQESTNPLLSFPVKSYEYLGSIVRDKQNWAIVRAPDNKVYQVTINNRFGNHYGRIIKINTDHLEVEEQAPSQEMGEEGQGTVKQIVTLQLKGGSE